MTLLTYIALFIAGLLMLPVLLVKAWLRILRLRREVAR